MRREAKQQSYIDWLKSLGCLVYLPLSEDGDLQDRISGLSLQLTGNGSLVWDNGQQRYKLTTPSANKQYVAILDNGINVADFSDNKFSVCQRIKKITNSSSKYLKACSPYDMVNSSSDAFNPAYNGTGRTSVWPSYEENVAHSYNANIDRSYYQNGSLYGTYSPYNPYLPSNWNLQGSGVLLGASTATSSYTNVQQYISEIYLFNTALDLQTIRKIQGYE